MRHTIAYLFSAIISISFLAGCTKDLDRTPTNAKTAEEVYSTPEGYMQAFTKVYGSFAMTGNNGEGSGDIQGIDPGTSDFFRLFWNAQELSTDEAVVSWGDAGIQDFHNMNWTASNPFLTGLYYRSLYQISLANDFIRQSTDEKLSSRGIKGADAEKIKGYAQEARFLRAYQYWVLMDLFGNPPFVTEKDNIGDIPVQISRSDLFNYVESELKDLENTLPNARSNEYGRADRAAAWALLARVYLNAKVYTGQERYSDAITYANKVISAGYSLTPDYRWLMLADNDKNTDEFILTINYDGLNTKNYGGSTYLTHASVGGSMNANDYGVGGGWAGLRTTRNIPNLFPDYTGDADKRAQFYTAGQNIDIDDQSVFTDGFAVYKFRNLKRDGTVGKSLDFSDIDIPIFRLGEIYLIYAEAVLRGGTGGDNATALGYINALRQRAYGDNSGNINQGDLTLDFILDERARELYWEGYRRSDLIRYGKFTTNSYLWPWKGGVKSGTAVADYRNLYPLPLKDVAANPNLDQNPNY
ncbi:MAG: RagB/SusD family nutrient uptake outer membrane protein [Chitinophagaceae bacterium]|nr:RagB/SusD family nutrient uptake outer membrane protein [Chitinophagaceae bacterium]